MVSGLVTLQIQDPIQNATDQTRNAVRIRPVPVPAVVPVVITALESLAEVVLVLGQVYVVAIVAERSVLITERVTVVEAPPVFAIGLAGSEAFLITLVQCPAKHVRAVLIGVVVPPTAIVAVAEGRVVIASPGLKSQPVLAQSLIVLTLKAKLRNSPLLFEYALALINESLLLLLLSAILRKALLLPPLAFKLLLLAKPLLVDLLSTELLLSLLVDTLLVDRLALLPLSLSLLLELCLLLLCRGLSLTPLIHPLLFLLSLLLLSFGLALTPLIHPLLLLLSLLLLSCAVLLLPTLTLSLPLLFLLSLLLLRLGLALTALVHALLLLLSLLLLRVVLALLPPSLTLLLLLLLLSVLLRLLLAFGFLLLLLLLLGSLIVGLCARQSAGPNQQGNYDNSQVCHTVKEFVVHMSSRIANALLRLFQHVHSRGD